MIYLGSRLGALLGALGLAAGILAPPPGASAANAIITTLAGGGVGDGGPAIDAALSPRDVAVDAAGTIYIADPVNARVRRIDASGTITTVAGNGVPRYEGDGGPATLAGLRGPTGIAVDGSGVLYISDPADNRIRMVDPSGTISTLAGNGVEGFDGDGGPATEARLNQPTDVVVDSSGGVYLADSFNDRIRHVSPIGIISTVAGGGPTPYIGDGLPATMARLGTPEGLTNGPSSDLYIADTLNGRVRRVTSGIIVTVAGSGRYDGLVDAPLAILVTLRLPTATALGPDGSLYIADTFNHRIRRVDPAGRISTVAGSGDPGFSGDAGPAEAARLDMPAGLSVAPDGSLFIADSGNNRVRKVDPSGLIWTIAGNGFAHYCCDDGLATGAGMDSPTRLAADSQGNVYIADADDHRVRRVSSSGTISTIAGTGEAGFSGDGDSAAEAQLASPRGVAIDEEGNVYIADALNDRVRKVSPAGTISTVAGSGEGGFSGDGGPATEASLSLPRDVAIDLDGNLLISDRANGRIRMVDGDGVITTVAGDGSCCFSGDGGPAAEASIGLPRGISVDHAGNLYIGADNNRVRVVDPSGLITTIAGTGSSGFSGDGGPATLAELSGPGDTFSAPDGTLYIADSGNARVRTVDPDGMIRTVAGNGTRILSGDGGPALTAGLSATGVVLTDRGLLIADSGNHRVRLVVLV